MTTYEISPEYSQIANIVLNEVEELEYIVNSDVRIAYLKCDEVKKKNGKSVYADCELVKDKYKIFIPYDFVITVYEKNTMFLTDDQMKVLLWHELKHVGIDEMSIDKPYKIVPHDIEEFLAIADKHGIRWDEDMSLVF